MDNYLSPIFDDDEEITEGKISVMKRGVGSKRAALAGAGAMGIARVKNPSLFKMYRKHNLIRKQIKEKIEKQYGALAMAMARKKLH